MVDRVPKFGRLLHSFLYGLSPDEPATLNGPKRGRDPAALRPAAHALESCAAATQCLLHELVRGKCVNQFSFACRVRGRSCRGLRQRRCCRCEACCGVQWRGIMMVGRQHGNWRHSYVTWSWPSAGLRGAQDHRGARRADVAPPGKRRERKAAAARWPQPRK